ncbi:FAD-binding domain-containing protein [Glonium stellatum]|uniref:FAD-binding domain-containing protein n=1 Tax=Glonium stellatum TaxID=574774 RepID=A0A8E2EWU8_9PEZI|nr:FAD-binding domain-containing protein [Glonium stellatum]
MPSTTSSVLFVAFFLFYFLSSTDGLCKFTPASPGWPSIADWNALNSSLSGRLLRPLPPGAVCHLSEPDFNVTVCATVAEEWLTNSFHVNNPISSEWNNWNNDSCLPVSTDPCSGEGYPVYVINATSAEHVKLGVDFARKNNVRLNVKGTGHDYLGRSTAPNSLSIWTHNLHGITTHSSFEPQGCGYSIPTTAVTAAAGHGIGDVYLAIGPLNQIFVAGLSETIGLGGYLTGGGHSPLSSTYGLATDQVLEMELVTPGGDIVTINECQNTDLFWAMRGGGGSTFGVMTSVTLKTFPAPTITAYIVNITAPADLDAFWSTMAYVLSQYPYLSDNGASGYTYMNPQQTSTNGTNPSSFTGLFYAFNTSISAISALFVPIQSYINQSYPQSVFFSAKTYEIPDFYKYYLNYTDTAAVGSDILVSSRLLDGVALSKPLPVLKKTLKAAIPPGLPANINLISGKGVWNAQPRGGSDAVNPAWRKAYAHFIVGVTWEPLNETAKKELEWQLTYNYTQALRDLAPDSGAYVNEADKYEPNWQQTFWGSNYPRLLEIKRAVDPTNVLWCHPCVGSEGWKMFGNDLCEI